MKEITGNLWDYFKKPNTAIVITTNGFVKNNGACVMGRGCAKEATQRIPRIEFILGSMIKECGNIVYRVVPGVYSFPVKDNWWEDARLDLIEIACKELSRMVTEELIVIPRPGCGNGRLLYTDVKPILKRNLDDRFSIITFKRSS